MLRVRVCSVVIGMTIATQGAAARAGEAGSAAALFENGLQDMRAARYETACPKLAESYALDARPGVVFTLAECEAKWGKLASAVAHYEDYLHLYAAMPPGMRSFQRDRAAIAKRQRDALSALVPMLTLTLPAGGATGLVVKRDDITLGAPSFGVALPVDPGSHEIVVVAGGVSRSQTVKLSAGDHVRVDLGSLTASRTGESTRASSARPVPSAAIAMFGVGAAALVVGGVTGGVAIAGKATIADHCKGTVCDVEGKKAADRAKALGWVSTASVGVGVAGVATGVVLWLLAPRESARVGRAPIRPVYSFVQGTSTLGFAGRF